MSLLTTELIAIEYQWECTMCPYPNREIEITEGVTCRECGAKHDVIDFHHNYKRY